MANGDSNENNLGDSSEAAMSLNVESKDILELTVTKTCLEVLTKLGAVSQICHPQRGFSNSMLSMPLDLIR